MKKGFLITLSCLFLMTGITQAQNKLSVDKVYATYLRNSGTIMENNQIKGYFFLYQSDKIDKNTNEYTLQILDQNLNKVKEIKFEDSKKLSLLEASYNESTLAFLFKNATEKTLDMKIYDMDGKLKFNYSSEYDKRTDDLMGQYETMHTDEGTNQNVFDLGDQGYVSVLPLRDGRQRTYAVNYYSSGDKKQWTYQPQDEEKFTTAEFLGSTGDLIILEVMKKKNLMSNKVDAHLVGISIQKKKMVFDIDDDDNGEYKFVPSSAVPLNGKNEILIMGSYFNKGDNIVKDFSQGLAVYAINSDGKVITKSYNSWADDFGKYLPLNKKGKLDKVGYLYIHKLVQTPTGKIFVVSEGYKRQASAGGIALTALMAAGGGHSNAVGVTKIVVTDMVIMEFNDKFKVKNATIYDKTNNTVEASALSDFGSQHAIAMMVKMTGGFDYEFTTGDADNSNFTICYSDWVKNGEYKGKTFNAIRYNGSKFSTDKIELKSKASTMKVFPAKAGSIMIMEYFRKDKRLDFRLEKLG